jgi:hypothetical protein
MPSAPEVATRLRFTIPDTKSIPAADNHNGDAAVTGLAAAARATALQIHRGVISAYQCQRTSLSIPAFHGFDIDGGFDLDGLTRGDCEKIVVGSRDNGPGKARNPVEGHPLPRILEKDARLEAFVSRCEVDPVHQP